MKKNIGILIFDNVEVLDFAEPFEVFSVTSELNNNSLFNVFLVGESLEPISAANGLSVNPKYEIYNCPHIDIQIIAGGSGSKLQMENTNILNWIKVVHRNTQFTISICSGSRLLGILNLLDDKIYCTHKLVYDDMAEIVPTGFPLRESRYVKSGKIYTSGGISAGIDLSFHLVENLCGRDIADRTAEYMEYEI